MTDKHKNIFGMAWYTAEQWPLLLSVSEDADQMEKDHDSWRRNAQEKMLQLQIDGVNIRRVNIDVNALVAWCAENKKRINGQSRAEFTSHVLREGHMTT